VGTTSGGQATVGTTAGGGGMRQLSDSQRQRQMLSEGELVQEGRADGGAIAAVTV
jgi:hypothetical protein